MSRFKHILGEKYEYKWTEEKNNALKEIGINVQNEDGSYRSFQSILEELSYRFTEVEDIKEEL